jgi:hypothetical protein
LAFIKAKRNEHVVTLDKVDLIDKFETFIPKWKKKNLMVTNAISFQHMLFTRINGETF